MDISLIRTDGDRSTAAARFLSNILLENRAVTLQRHHNYMVSLDYFILSLSHYFALRNKSDRMKARVGLAPTQFHKATIVLCKLSGASHYIKAAYRLYLPHGQSYSISLD